ncbi:hypothetical protein [Altericista sp. CCNU0014]|uniref:hypothetical protein n=1 Tax=Altericista sp. CCNU0014 TaxID=3082949 RepID=UPI00384E7727
MMTQWQFLIQKEGDRDWLPLESPNVEILEGRYNLMAKGDRPSAQVEIQIRHEYELEGVPQEVTQRRRQHTDSQGLLELFPLTYLPPGLWELQCRVAESQAQQERAASQKLFLQVLAQDFELLSDWAGLEPSLAETLPTESAAGNPADRQVAIAPAPTQKAGPVVRLPFIPKELAPLPLRLSEPLCLPPVIYIPQNSTDEAESPELPPFLLSVDLRGNSLVESAPAIPTATVEPTLSFLRRVAKSTDRQAAYRAFEPLARRQRFLKTLDILAQASLSSRELLKAR